MGILDTTYDDAPLLEALEVRGRCASCHYWSQHPATTTNGECRRHSPLCSENEANIFPITYSNCWCGDFQASEPPVAEVPSG